MTNNRTLCTREGEKDSADFPLVAYYSTEDWILIAEYLAHSIFLTPLAKLLLQRILNLQNRVCDAIESWMNL